MRAGSRTRPPLIWLILVILVIIAGGGIGLWISQNTGDPYRTIEKLNAETYLENGNSLRGNQYKIEGVVQNSLAWSDDKSRLFAVRISDQNPPVLLPVIIPPELSATNLEKGQKIAMKVEVIQGGFIRALETHKQ